MRQVLILIVVCLLSPFENHARAGDESVAKARALYEAGISHYNLSEYKEALDSFRAAYRLKNDPALLFNIAQCYRQLGEPAQAANFYRAFRREYPDAPNRREIDRLILEMDKAAAEKGAKPVPAPSPPSTSATSPAAAARASQQRTPASVIVTAPPPPRRRPLVKRPWFWATLAGAAAVVATGVALGVVYGTQTRDPVATSGQVDGN
jgi:tetratricopeptide (TPR) repeat protein